MSCASMRIQIGLASVILLAVLVSGVCNEAGLQSAMSQCDVACCGSTGCSCSGLCSVAALSAGTCDNFLGYNNQCRHADCLKAAMTTNGCETSPSYSLRFLEIIEVSSTCEAWSASSGCTYRGLEDARVCADALPCTAANATSCTTVCYTEALRCFTRATGCSLSPSSTVGAFCRSQLQSVFQNMCFGSGSSCFAVGGASECSLAHMTRCVEVEDAARTPAPTGVAPPDASSSDGALLGAVIALVVVVVVLTVVLIAVIAVSVARHRAADGRVTPVQVISTVGPAAASDSHDEGDSSHDSDPVGKARDTRRSSNVVLDAKRMRSIRRQVTAGEWQRGKLLGKGSSGSVYQCVLGDGSFVALKQIDARLLSADEARQLCEELRLMAHLRHAHIIRYYYAAYDEEEKVVNLWMELVHGGSLSSLIKKLDDKLSESVVRVYTRQIVLGLKFLHDKKIVHRDCKPENFLLSADGVVKLADFGSAKMLVQRGAISVQASGPSVKYTDSIIGTPNYISPEVVKSADTNVGYDTKVDIWSLGIAVCEMLNHGESPWPSFPSVWAAMFHIGNLSEPPPLPECSELCRNFLKRCLQIDPRSRATAAELLTLPWLAEADVSLALESQDDVTSSYEFTDAIRQLQRGFITGTTATSADAYSSGGGGGGGGRSGSGAADNVAALSGSSGEVDMVNGIAADGTNATQSFADTDSTVQGSAAFAEVPSRENLSM